MALTSQSSGPSRFHAVTVVVSLDLFLVNYVFEITRHFSVVLVSFAVEQD